MANSVQRLIQFILRGKDEMSPAAKQSTEALEAMRGKVGQLNQALDDAKGARGLVTGLENTRRVIGSTEASLLRAQNTVQALREALDKNPDSKGYETSLKAAERNVSTLQRTLDTLNTKLAEQEKAAVAAGIDTSKLSEEEKRLAAEVERAKAQLAAANEELRKLERQQRQTADSSSRMSDAVRNIKTGVTDATVNFGKWLVSIYLVDKALQGLGAGVGFLKDGIGAFIGSGSDNEQALAQLEAALTSTGNAAGLTSQQLLDMADSMRSASMLTTEQILSAETRLLSYTDIAAKQFPQALQITIDQAQRLGISVEQSAETVGKALQSPSDAMATLSRQGFKLEDGQKQLLKQLEATGKKAEAQAIIINMMTEAYGGAAASARLNTFRGLMKTLGDQFGDFAGKVADSGAFDYVKRRLTDLSSSIKAMADDGRLDRLASGISDAFIQGIDWIGKFVDRLGTVDFESVIGDVSGWLHNFSANLDEMATKVKLFVAPFRTLFNGITSGLSLIGLGFTNTMGLMASAIEWMAKKIPDALGGEKIRASVAGVQGTLKALSSSFKSQIEQDAKDIAAAWDTAGEGISDGAKSTTGSVKKELDETFEHTVQRVTGINNALAQISAAEGVEQLRQLSKEMYDAYKRGDLSQEQYSQGTAVLNERLRKLGGTSATTGTQLKGVSDSLKSLTDVQNAIANARTDVDIDNIRKSITKLYQTGVISSSEYNQAMKDLESQQERLKRSTDGLSSTMDTQAESTKGLTKSQQMMNEAMEDGIVTTEELRRISGERMEEERKGVQATKDNIAETSADMSDFAGFYEGVINQARQPLAELGKEALAAFDQLRGISTTDISIDTSSLESTTKALQQMRSELDRVQGAASMPGLSGLGRWALSMQEESKRVAVSFLEQKQQLLSLMDGYEKKTIPLSDFVDKAKAARNSMNLLNDSDLRQLESAIDSAKQRMDQLENGTRDTLTGLKEELAGLRGETEAVDRSKFNSRRQDLQQQLAEAQAGGNLNAVQNIMEALATLQQIQAETDAKRQLAEQQARVDAQNAAQAQAPAPAAAAPATAAPSQPMKTIRLEVQGRSVDVGVTDDGSQLLDLLGKAALRTS